MALTTFKDLPDTSTPLNSENLNKNFDISQNEITIGVTNDVSYTLSTRGKIPFNTTLSKSGNKLSFNSSDYCVEIGDNISYIEASARSLQQTTAAGLCGILITKNGTGLDDAFNIGFSYISTENQLHCVGLPPVLVKVSKGDRIYVCGYGPSNGYVTLTNYTGRGTTLTVKAIG